jgi:hypothetical protein
MIAIICSSLEPATLHRPSPYWGIGLYSNLKEFWDSGHSESLSKREVFARDKDVK